MLVIVSADRLDNDQIEIGDNAYQHDSNHSQNYPSEEEVRAVLSDLGISEELNSFSPEIASTDGYGRRIKIPTDGCSAELIAV